MTDSGGPLESELPLVVPAGLHHVAMIMDGNGRWASARGLPRAKGHQEGANTVRELTTALAASGLGQLTLYALSVENHKRRPRTEVDFLLSLLRRFLAKERATIMANDIRFKTIGRIDEFPPKLIREIRELEEISADNRGMILCLALNYGGQSEIADAAKAIAAKVKSGEVSPDAIDEDLLGSHLYDPDMPPLDLMIRTAGEMRVSNFLLWQVSYSEIYVTDSFWPDFHIAGVARAFESYAQRRRRFGGLENRVDARTD
ncbi:MAG: polyprenyl diphosphate synthase [Planctomycetota bacterium]